jgi:hypothetical protein
MPDIDKEEFIRREREAYEKRLKDAGIERPVTRPYQADLHRIRAQRAKLAQSKRAGQASMDVFSGGMSPESWFGISSSGKQDLGGMSFNPESYDQLFNSGFGAQNKNSWNGNLLDIGGPASNGINPPNMKRVRDFYGF